MSNSPCEHMQPPRCAASGAGGRRAAVLRRDSPNGKRYARKGRGGELQFAFGFDLSPLVARADEFEGHSGSRSRSARRQTRPGTDHALPARHRQGLIATGIEEGVPTRREGQGPASWQDVHTAFRAILEGLAQGRDPPATRRRRLPKRFCNLPTISASFWKRRSTNMGGNPVAPHTEFKTRILY